MCTLKTFRCKLSLLSAALACLTFLGAAPRQKSGRQMPPAVPVVRTNGLPYEIARHAKPTYTPEYDYGWVGGGAPTWRGEPRRANEGVWGRDYLGVLYLRRVWPNWWHGRRYQGGAGAYATEGPKLLHH